jgi:predicted RNA-binding protein with EMAP domain
MDTQYLINAALGATIGIAGWLGRQLWDAVQKMKDDIHRLEIDLPSHYIRRDEFAESLKELKEMLNKIFDRLDNKVDK